MAINTTTATIQMRRGSEAAFNPDKMMPGEWAVSLDSKYVRMCFAPGLCLRMATYEGFEADMKEVQKILKECQDINASVKHFEQLAQEHSVESESWAVGGTGTRDGEDTNNSRYFSELAKRIVNAATQGALIPMGTIPFANLPTSNIESGWMYNISNDFTSDSRFEDGGGIKYKKGANVYYTANGKWDVLAGMQVTGVKGSAESAYRTGDVNLTSNDVYAQSVHPEIHIPTNSNLNDYITPGCYSVLNSNIAKTILNSPIDNSGYMLTVYNTYGSPTNLISQSVLNFEGRTYFRNRTQSGTWTNWVQRYIPMTGATASAAGKAGLVPAPPKGAQGKVLKGNATWGDAEIAYRGAYADFPATGNPNLLYIDDTVDPHLMYTWDSGTSKYILTGGAGGADGSSIDIPITLPASGWTGTAAPYSQTVTVPQIRETMTPLLYFSGTGDAAQYAYSLITGYEAGYAQMTFSAADKPQVDIPITLKGVPAQQLEFADNTVVVVVSADGFSLNEELGRYEKTIPVDGMAAGANGGWDIVRAGDVLTEAESKIALSITDVIPLDGAIKIVCLWPPEQQYMLKLVGTYTQAAEGTTLLAGMQGWFDKVEELEKGSLFYVDYKLTITADSSSASWSAYGTKNIAVASATPVSAQIIGSSNFYGSVTLNANSGAVYVYGAIAGEYTIRVLYAHTD